MNRLKIFEQFIAEKNEKPLDDNKRVALTLDGTSSAGKSYTAEKSGLKSKTRWKKDKDGNYVKDKDGNFVRNEVADDEYQTIALDDYWGDAPLDDPNAPENQARWELEKNDPFYTDEERAFSKKWGDTFAHIGKDYKELVTDWKASADKKIKSGKDEDGNDLTKEQIKDLKDESARYEQQLKEWPDPARNHPDWDAAKKKAKEKGHEFREWEPQRFYMSQEYKQSKNKNIIFDDITGDVSQYLPDGATKTVLLHAPMDKLVKNIERREKNDPRDPKHVFDDYASKYEFTKEKPSNSTGQPGKPIKKKDIMALLKKSKDKNVFKESTIDDEWIENFTKNMGLDDDNATYYMKVKDDYIKQNEPIIVNAGPDNQKTFKAFNDVVKAEEKRVASGEKKVGKDSKEEIKTIKDTTSKNLFKGVDPKVVKKIETTDVTVPMPGGKKKTILTRTLMDFVPIDLKDPEEAAMVKAQERMYKSINKIRSENNLSTLIPFQEYVKRNIELAKDNKAYQARVKAKALSKMKNKTNESYCKTFEGFLNENYQKGSN